MNQRFQNFLTGITVCYKYIQRIKNAEMTEFGLKGTHVACIFYLNHNPEGLTSAQLCTLCAEDKASISRTVAFLRQKGFIEPGGAKNYRTPLRLTDAGREVAQQMAPAIEEWVSIGGIGLSDEQRASFYDTLALIADNLRSELDG
jgi:DNA-binding MarR family transcriptional regulator